MANVQIGKYLYGREEMPMAARILQVLSVHKAGWPAIKIAENAEILAIFGNDRPRTLQRVGVTLANLRFRKVISMVSQGGADLWKVDNQGDASEIMKKGLEISAIIQTKCAEVKETMVVSETNDGSNKANKANKVKNMSTVTKATKAPKLFLNPETDKVEPFGAGRPSKVKTACACDAEGKYLNPQLATAFLQNGGKADDKLTKDELMNLVKNLRAEVADLTAQKNSLAEALVKALSPEVPETNEETEETEDSKSEGEAENEGEAAQAE